MQCTIREVFPLRARLRVVVFEMSALFMSRDQGREIDMEGFEAEGGQRSVSIPHASQFRP